MFVADDIRRRIKAARALAGYSVSDLAERTAEQGLGERTLRKMESGERPARRMELDQIAVACGLPPAWFTADLSRLGELAVEAPNGAATDLEATLQDVLDRLQRLEDRRSGEQDDGMDGGQEDQAA